MKFLKKVLAAVACVCVLATSVTLTSHAAGGRISFADPSTAVGDMVDVKCVFKIQQRISWKFISNTFL